MAKHKNKTYNKEKIIEALNLLKQRKAEKVEKETARHKKEIDTINNRFDILISKRQQELKDVDNDLLDEPVVIDGLIFKYQENIDDYKKTNAYKINHEKHLICNLCNNPFFGYTEAMYRQAPLATKKRTKYWKHFERNGGNCIDECDECTTIFYSRKARKKHKCSQDGLILSTSVTETDSSETSDSNISMTISETETETETESNSSEYESSEYESSDYTGSEYDAPAILEAAKFIPKPINTPIEYLTEGNLREFKINDQQYYHRIRDNKVLNWDCKLEVGTVENNNLVLFSK